MVTNPQPALFLEQLDASHRRKRSIEPELLERLAQQDSRVFELLLRHRSGEPVEDAIVAELLPVVAAKSERMSPVRLYGRDDLRQQLIAELFHVARKLPLRRPDYVTRRLMMGAAKRLTRRLEREWFLQLAEWYQQLNSTTLDDADGDSEEDMDGDSEEEIDGDSAEDEG